jgi:hypothetical protein
LLLFDKNIINKNNGLNKEADMIGEEILSDIDTTLDKLIENAESISGVNLSNISKEEIDAFQKTQESLLAHLISMDQMLETKRKTLKNPNKKSVNYQIQQKLIKFKDANNGFVKNMSKNLGIVQVKKPKRKRRSLKKVSSQLDLL